MKTIKLIVSLILIDIAAIIISLFALSSMLEI